MVNMNSTIHEIEQAHETMNLRQLAKEIGIGEAKLKQALKSVGYRYNSATKKWSYLLYDTSKDYRNRSLESVMEQLDNGNTNITDTEAGVNEVKKDESEKYSITHITNTEPQGIGDLDITKCNIGNKEVVELTQDEIIILKQLAQKQLALGNSTSISSGSTEVLEALKSVPSGSTSKKTFVIQDELIAQLDAFCELHRIRKSDFLALAIREVLSNFS